MYIRKKILKILVLICVILLYAQTIDAAKQIKPNYYVPANPVNLTSKQGNFWVNHTWQAGVGNKIDSYNISINGKWINGTKSTYFNNSVGPHGWSNITVWAYNNSGKGSLSLQSIYKNVQIVNHLPVISVADKTLNEGDMLTFVVSASDIDNDFIIYGTNATKGTFNTTTGEFSWNVGYGDSKIYVWNFNVSDNYGGSSSKDITITINDVPLSITNFSPVDNITTNTTNTTNTLQIFELSLNRTADITWYIDGVISQKNNSAISANYTNSTVMSGIYNITMIANDSYDTVLKKWNWTVKIDNGNYPSYNTEQDCRNCHGNDTSNNHHIVAMNKNYECTYCHQILYNNTGSYPQVVRDCLVCHPGENHNDCIECHGTIGVTKTFVNITAFNESIHQEINNTPITTLNNLDCWACHYNKDMNRQNIKKCGDCHNKPRQWHGNANITTNLSELW